MKLLAVWFSIITVTTATVPGLLVVKNITGGSAATGSKPVVYLDTVSAEDSILKQRMNASLHNLCVLFYAECWVLYKSNKPYQSDQQRTQECLKRVSDYSVCHSVTEAEANNAIVEAEQLQKRKVVKNEDMTVKHRHHNGHIKKKLRKQSKVKKLQAMIDAAKQKPQKPTPKKQSSKT